MVANREKFAKIPCIHGTYMVNYIYWLSLEIPRKRTVKTLSKETMTKIAQVEAQAAQILEEAKERARAMSAETEQKCNEDRERIEAETELRLRRMLDDMQKRSTEILERSRESAQKEADEMNRKAEFRMEEAVKAIVWGILEQCQ